MKDTDLDKKIIETYDEELQNIPIPLGLEEELSDFIDNIEEQSNRKSRRIAIWYRTATIAASIAVIFLLTFYFMFYPQSEPLIAEEIKTPVSAVDDSEEVYREFADALALMSTQWNKGIAQLNQAGENIEKSNQRINRTIKQIKK